MDLLLFFWFHWLLFNDVGLKIPPRTIFWSWGIANIGNVLQWDKKAHVLMDIQNVVIHLRIHLYCLLTMKITRFQSFCLIKNVLLLRNFWCRLLIRLQHTIYGFQPYLPFLIAAFEKAITSSAYWNKCLLLIQHPWQKQTDCILVVVRSACTLLLLRILFKIIKILKNLMLANDFEKKLTWIQMCLNMNI